jgi:hypothetical protein
MGALQNLSLQNSARGWVADSGATSHLTSDHGMLLHSSPLSNYPPVLVGNGSTMHVSRIGTSPFLSQIDLSFSKTFWSPLISSQTLFLFAVSPQITCVQLNLTRTVYL